MENYDLLAQRIKEWGASKVGLCELKEPISENFKDLHFAVSIAVRLSDAIINEIDDKPTHTYFHHYRSVNSLIDNITLKASLLLEDWGYLAVAIPASQTVKKDKDPYTGIFQHKTAARLSGLGWIGKNDLLITPEYGPRIRLGTIITNMNIPEEKMLIRKNCGDCNLCQRMCPAMAIIGNNWSEGIKRSEILDAEACSNYMNTNFKKIGRGSVCGICIKVCPNGYKVIK